MSRTIRKGVRGYDSSAAGGRPRAQGRRQRDITLRPVRRRDPDLRRLGRALIALALAEAEAEAAGLTVNEDAEMKQPGTADVEPPDGA